MAEIKIISNPYEQNIAFQRKKADGEWVAINYDNNPNSKLIKEDLRRGFLPFIAQKILDAVIDEYQDENGRVAIVFEGTQDEWRELKLVSEDKAYNGKVVLTQSENHLNNARDILPEIIEIFKKLKPLLSEGEDDDEAVGRALEKFADVAKDVIPICVVGNYSSGKSTFINALIGHEIMPSGAEPVTAKIYSILRSPDESSAAVSFEYEGQDVRIIFADGRYTVFSSALDNDLIAQIKSALNAKDGTALPEQVHDVLVCINKYENAHENAGISDLIEVSVPTGGGLWQDGGHQFVIFDTPGSNAAGKGKHLQVLQKAMANLSNGVPVYVSEYNTLDSIDNEQLITEIKKMPGLDARFAMVVVNKADTASLPKDGFDAEAAAQLLSEAIPKNLSGEGIFFVSSVMGLGAKTGGQFIDEHSSEIFDDQAEKYQDPGNKRYKQLYRYDVMPGKQKDHMLAAAASCNDLTYVNSGLFSVEHEISNFADKYAAYNKCFQARKFLDEMIGRTAQHIAETKADREARKKAGEEKLTEDKNHLIAAIKEQGEAKSQESQKAYYDYMAPLYQDILEKYYQESLKDEQAALLKSEKEARNFEDMRDIVDRHAQSLENQIAKNLDKKSLEKRFKNFGSRLKENVKNLNKITLPDADKIKMAGEEFVNGARAKIDQAAEWIEDKNAINESVKNDLIDMLNRDYQAYCTQAQDDINQKSISYWQEQAADIKQTLIQIVTEAPILSDKRREELTEIITAYQNVDFEKQVFDKKDFEWPDKKMNLEKLKNAYNRLMDQEIEQIKRAVRESHESSFKAWLLNLYQTVADNIVAFNPGLREQQQIIDQETATIASLEAKQTTIAAYAKAINDMMTWSV